MLEFGSGEGAPARDGNIAPSGLDPAVDGRSFVDVEGLAGSQQDGIVLGQNMLLAPAEVVYSVSDIAVGRTVGIEVTHRVGTVGQQEEVVVAVSVEFDRNLAMLPARKCKLDRIGSHGLGGDAPGRGAHLNLREWLAFLDPYADRTVELVEELDVAHRVAEFLGVVPVVPDLFVKQRRVGAQGVVYLDRLPGRTLQHVDVVVGVVVLEGLVVTGILEGV